MAKTKIIMSKRTKKVTHLPNSKHVASVKGKGGKRASKKVSVKC